MTKKYDVVSLCNALKDIMFEVSDEELKSLGLNKGIMHIVDSGKQADLMNTFSSKTKKEELGGSGLNTIRALSLMNSSTAFAGMIGKDSDGNSIKSRLDDLKIQRKLDEHTGESTGTCVILVTPDKERTMHTNLGASCLYGKSLVPEDEIKESKVFHFCGYQWDTDSQKEAILHAIKIAKESGALISFDVADPFVVNRHKSDIENIVREHADIVFANREETKSLFEGKNAESEIEAISNTGTIFVHKKDKDGADVHKDGQKHFISPVETNVVDLTAAGDMFAAGFLYGFVNQKPLTKCGEIASILASDVISRLGATLSDEAIQRALKA